MDRVRSYYNETMNEINCPHCGKRIQISEALRHEFEEKVRNEEKAKAKEEIVKIKEQTFLNAQKIFKEQSEKELLKAAKEKEYLVKLLEENKKEQEKNAQKIKEEANKEAEKEFGLKLKEKDKQLEDAREAAKIANEELKRKLNQGSQQLQGDVLEKELEDRLKEAFPNDEFKPVPTGVRGGDIIQEVRNNHGNSAGVILWEAKRTKAWKKDWLTKLKDDMRNINATDCVLVTEVMPPNTNVYDRIDNAWVSTYEHAIKLASVIRFGILKVAIARSSASHTDEQLKELYDVITSDSFRQMFEARDEIINALKIELEADKRSAEKRWKRQGTYIEKLDRNNSRMYGELEAHIPSLKPLKEPDLLSLGEGNDEIEQETLI